MPIIRGQKKGDFTTVSNQYLRNTALSMKAKGLLTFMLSLPDDWVFTIKGLSSVSGESVGSIGGALKELERAGHLTRERVRLANGRLAHAEYTVYEDALPVEEPSPNPARPEGEKPMHAKPEQGDSAKRNTRGPGTAYASGKRTRGERRMEKSAFGRVSSEGEKTALEEPEQENPAQENAALLNTKIQNTEIPNTEEDRACAQGADPSIYPSCNRTDTTQRRRKCESEIQACRERLKKNIEYECIAGEFGAERLDEAVELMLEAILAQSPSVRIAGSRYPREVVASRLLKLRASHIGYVFACIDSVRTKIRNIKAYLLTSLFNAPATIDSYCRAEMNRRGFAPLQPSFGQTG